MGRMLKNTVFKNGSHALGVPAGTSSIGPDHPINGQTRYNTTNGQLEFYNNSLWNAVAKQGNVTIVADTTFVGTGSQTLFEPMTYAYNSGQEAQVLVFVGTVYQIPVTNYTFAGNSSITFISPPSGSSAITILHNFASTVAA